MTTLGITQAHPVVNSDESAQGELAHPLRGVREKEILQVLITTMSW